MCWELKPLEDVCSICNGGTPKSSVESYWGGDVNWLTPKDMGKMQGRHISTTPRKISEEGLRNCSARLVPTSSVIMSTRAPIGHLAINDEPMSFNQGCRGMVPGNRLDVIYLYYFLSANTEKLNELGTGTTFKELSSSALKAFSIPLPPLEEQQRIVAILDEAFEGLDRARAHAEANLQNARELFRSVLDSVFFNPPEHWTQSDLGSTCKFVGGSQPPKSEFVYSSGDDLVRLIQIRDYKSDRNIVFIPKSLARRFCEEDDVMIGRYGPPLFQILRGIKGAYNVALMKALPDPKCLSKDFLYYFLRNGRILRYIIESSSRAAGQIGLNKATIEPYPIAYPSAEEQIKVVQRLDAASAECDALESKCAQKLKDIEDLGQSLLQKAFAGELT
ncbi:restriction endonuclease subunit S [Hyphomonas sp.]|uniref:restriction endonuclease subunit S n=1 Tax=Hyphomonas sp. TaxID=87 RepID=UPI003D2A639D